jgi:hypothetical protein
MKSQVGAREQENLFLFEVSTRTASALSFYAAQK